MPQHPPEKAKPLAFVFWKKAHSPSCCTQDLLPSRGGLLFLRNSLPPVDFLSKHPPDVLNCRRQPEINPFRGSNPTKVGPNKSGPQCVALLLRPEGFSAAAHGAVRRGEKLKAQRCCPFTRKADRFPGRFSPFRGSIPQGASQKKEGETTKWFLLLWRALRDSNPRPSGP